MSLKGIKKVIKGMPAEDGAGVKLYRIIGTPELGQLDPFLLLDEIRSTDSDDYIAGFPPHPHRGFETVTYMKNGRFRHRDSNGNEGLLSDGGIQWMTAGRGIIHSETPEITEGQLWGYQLWINLPASLKMTDPGYQDIQQDQLPVIENDDWQIRVLSGNYQDATSPAKSFYPLDYFDVNIKAGKTWHHQVPEDFATMVYVYEGSILTESTDAAVHTGELAILGAGQAIELKAGDTDAGALFLAAAPIKEPIARYGPFVMNTPEEIDQAVADFRQGVLHR